MSEIHNVRGVKMHSAGFRPAVRGWRWLLLAMIAGCSSCSMMEKPEIAPSVWQSEPTLGGPLLYRLDLARLQSYLRALPEPGAAATPGLLLSLPLPEEGRWSEFRVHNAATLPPGLARRYPQLHSLRGEDAAGRQVRLDLSSNKFSAKVWDDGHYWSIEPDPKAPSSLLYRVVRARVETAPNQAQPIPARQASAKGQDDRSPIPGTMADGMRHNFRIAVVASSTYTALFGGRIEDGLFGVMRTINQTNQIYETDLGVHFTLVEASDRLVLTDTANDPFESIFALRQAGFDQALFRTNVEMLRRELGQEGYDVGHLLLASQLFEGGIGGAGATGNSCVIAAADEPIGNDKGAGWTIHPDPVHDPVAISITSHELGHQFGAWHTNNGCSREANPAAREEFAYEPGSGSTVMSYASTQCNDPGHQLQNLGDAYFHAANLAQINSWLGSRGGQCAVGRLYPGPAPWIDLTSMPSAPTIPARTPFLLDAHVAHAAVGTHLRYTWEQMDAGSVQLGTLQDDGRRPIFRSYAPQSSSQRSFPRLEVILGEQPLGPGEAYPQTNRDLHFRLTVRDQRGRTDNADTKVRVVDTGLPFSVLQPQGVARWVQGQRESVRWQVAATAAAPINCSTVTLDLSVDGGHHYLPTPLAASVPNNGNATVEVPVLPEGTTQARVRARCDGNIFFAVSPGDFTIMP